MTQYTLTLKHTTKGGDGHSTVQSRRNKAIDVARKKHVDIISITPQEHGAIWVVDGSPSNVHDMISTWTGHGNVNVSGGP